MDRTPDKYESKDYLNQEFTVKLRPNQESPDDFLGLNGELKQRYVFLNAFYHYCFNMLY